MSELVSSNPLEIHQDDVIVVLGKRRSGKTNLVAWLVQNLEFQFLILDPIGNLAFLRSLPNVEYHYISVDNEEAISRILTHSPNKMVILDEIDLYSWHRDSLLNRVLQTGRNFGSGIIACARRPANIRKDVLSNSDLALVFSYREPRDTDYLRDWLNSEVDYQIKTPFTFRVFKDGQDCGLYSVEKVI